MAMQQGRDVIVAYKAQAALGTEEPGGAGATKLIYKDGSPGFSPVQAALIESTANLGDGQTERARRGTYSVPGSFNWEATAGGHTGLYPTFFRNAFASALTITEATGAMSAATLSVAGSVITFSAGSVITAGLRVYDQIKFASGLDAANNGQWLRIKALTATSITVYESLTAVAGPVAAYSFTAAPKLTQSTGSPILTFDTYFANMDLSMVSSDVKGNSLNFQLAENTTLDVTGNFLGTFQTRKASGASPHFTAPTVPNATSLAFLDACFAINGGEVLSVTGFNLGLELNATTLGVANGCSVTPGRSPDVFQGNGKPNGQWSMPIEDFALLTAAAGETQIEFMARFREPAGPGLFALVVANAIMTNEQLSPLGADGALIQTFDLAIGRDKRGGAFDATSMTLFDAVS